MTIMKNRVATFERLKSLPVNIAIVDASGTIVAVNETWEQFGRRNGLRVPRSAVGLNYLHYCLTDEPKSRRFVTQLKALLAGRRDLLTFVYPCHSQAQARWFCLVGLPLSLRKPGGIALLHVNLTTMLPLHIDAPRRTQTKGKRAQARPRASSSTVSIGEILERSVLEPLSSQLNEMFTGLTMNDNNGSDLVNAARARLSRRQMEVLKLLGQGKTNKEIAVELFLSPNTIKLYVSGILKRLKLKSRVQAALLSSKLLQDPSIEAKARAR